MRINGSISASEIQLKIKHFWEVSAQKLKSIEKSYDHNQGSPVFTVSGKYTTRGWTEWTKGFEIGSAILQYDATG